MMRATLPAVAELGTKLTKTFYDRMFREHPELLDTFNVRNQAGGAQPKALFNSIAVSATAVLEGKPIPDGFLEPINQKHCALHVTPAQYGVVGANLLAAIEDCLSPPKDVLNAWGDFYGVLAKACIEREEAIYKQASCPLPLECICCAYAFASLLNPLARVGRIFARWLARNAGFQAGVKGEGV